MKKIFAESYQLY